MRDSHTYTPTSEGLSLLDWQDEFYRTAMVQDYSLSVSGATDSKLYILRRLYESEGLATGTGYERFSFAQMLNLKSINTFRLELIWLLLIL